MIPHGEDVPNVCTSLPGLIHSASMHGTSPRNRDGVYSGPKGLTGIARALDRGRCPPGVESRRPSLQQSSSLLPADTTGWLRNRLVFRRTYAPDGRPAGCRQIHAGAAPALDPAAAGAPRAARDIDDPV